MVIALASDHAGYRYKTLIRDYLESKKIAFIDFGTHSKESCDYPDYIRPAAQAVANNQCQAGIIIGGSGNGEAIVANKVSNVRCAVCWNEYTAKMSKMHNNANMISIGERTISEQTALRIVDAWLANKFEGGRHLRRIQKIK